MPIGLFSPIELGPMHLANRIAVAPMCQYSADDGSATDWHIQHWMTLAMSGAAMITIEATGVERRGRITHGCLGLYSDDNEATVDRTVRAARRVAPAGTRFGIQLAHAGRKASTRVPWDGGGPLHADQDPWQTVGPSAVPFAEGWHVPLALDEGGIERTIAAFVSAAQRAHRIGLDFIELHFAHGYLVHEFLSPIANKRTDIWGGSIENRMRLAMTIARAVRAAVPSMAVGARISATDWFEGGFNPDEAVILSRALKEEGLVYICASSGGMHPKAVVPDEPHYQVHLSERVRREAGIPTRAVGLIEDPLAADRIIRDGEGDLVALGRALLADPRWPWRAAVMLGVDPLIVKQYVRSKRVVEQWARQAIALAPAAE